jgi:hypothetical protein
MANIHPLRLIRSMVVTIKACRGEGLKNDRDLLSSQRISSTQKTFFIDEQKASSRCSMPRDLMHSFCFFFSEKSFELIKLLGGWRKGKPSGSSGNNHLIIFHCVKTVKRVDEIFEPRKRKEISLRLGYLLISFATHNTARRLTDIEEGSTWEGKGYHICIHFQISPLRLGVDSFTGFEDRLSPREQKKGRIITCCCLLALNKKEVSALQARFAYLIVERAESSAMMHQKKASATHNTAKLKYSACGDNLFIRFQLFERNRGRERKNVICLTSHHIAVPVEVHSDS